MKKLTIKHYSLGKKRKLTLVCETMKTDGVLELYIGHAISNPIDVFDKRIGVLIATNRLNHDNPEQQLFYCGIETRFINDLYITSMMDGIAAFIKDSPNSLIKGYRK